MSDLADYYAYAKVDGVGQMAGWLPHKNIEESKAILTRFIKEKRTFALEYQGQVIGSLGIGQYNEEKFPAFADQRCCEIGFVLAKDHWGKGLMTEAVRAVINYLFTDQNCDVIFCDYFWHNQRSRRVQEKCGFHHLTDIKYTAKTGVVEETAVNILRKEEWQRQTGKS